MNLDDARKARDKMLALPQKAASYYDSKIYGAVERDQSNCKLFFQRDLFPVGTPEDRALRMIQHHYSAHLQKFSTQIRKPLLAPNHVVVFGW